MKIKINNYTFDASERKITFTDYSSIRLDGITLITNVENNQVIYNFMCAGLGGTVVDNVLTLDFDTTLMNDTDSLNINYNDGIYHGITQDDYYLVLNTIKDAVTNPVWYSAAANALQITGGVSVSSGTLTTLTNQTNIGGISADLMVENNTEQTWALSNRNLYI